MLSVTVMGTGNIVLLKECRMQNHPNSGEHMLLPFHVRLDE